MVTSQMESKIPPPIEETIAEIADSNKTLLRATVTELSSLNSAELEVFTGAWPGINPERRRQITNQIVELAENDIELNFNDILKYCLKDPDAEVRRLAIEGLLEDEEASLIEKLINLLENDSSEDVRAAAAAAMGKFALLAEHQKLPEEQIARIRKSLLTVLSNKSNTADIRRRALESAAPLSLPEIKQAIKDAYTSGNLPLKISAVYAMGKSCDPVWLPILIQELSSADAEVRYEAAGACGELEEESAVTALIKLVNDFDADVQMAAIQALGKIGNTQARECLQKCLESEDEAVSKTAEQVISELSAADDPLSFRL